MPAVRKIIHIDMDAFYASAELYRRPDLRGSPVVVAWDGVRSVICAASYEARRFGLHSAMSVAAAKRLCPNAVYIPPDFAYYRAISQQVHQIFARYTDKIEPLSLDEAYLDLTDYSGSLPYARDIARAIRADIFAETGLTASAGIAPNKFLAKIASDWRKPNGQFVIAPEQILTFLADLPVSKIPGVGKITAQKMHRMGWKTAGDLAKTERAVLVHHFGVWGHRLYDLVRGEDNREVKSQRIRQQISNEITLPYDEPLHSIGRHLPELAAAVAKQMQHKQMTAACVTLKLKSSDFHIHTRSQTFSAPLGDAPSLLAAGQQLLQRQPESSAAYRLIGLGVSHLLPHNVQLPLW
ncbi:DNA polymerase IV [Stenoxybacter acetivorans]|uniref:DNA polymerase IV n=1 Tax=Stenoxybacter acetivorans TaxID=422441 RepID=UPI000569884E|nr:DNA polymerase IV [Stenoxybacter acetivorans]